MEPIEQDKSNSFGIDDDIKQIVTNIDNYDVNALEENDNSFYKFMNQIDSDENDKKLKKCNIHPPSCIVRRINVMIS